MLMTEALVRKDVLGEMHLREREEARLQPGQVRVRIESFALTANNVTYAAFGDAMDYWRFFPSDTAGYGIVPAWGFGRVVQSLCAGVRIGERLYGFWPMASSATLRPERQNESGFIDAAPHRAGLHSLYNHYLRCAADPLWSKDTEDFQALLRPLFTTAWLIDDFLANNHFFGASTVLVSSASSKTACATAFHLQQRGAVRVVGLTADQRRSFCERIGVYDQVLAYEELDRLPADTALAFVDFAGRGALRASVHTRFANLKHDAAIGSTHHDQRGGPGDASGLPGPRATFFFAPAQVKKRIAEWGLAGYGDRMAQAWFAFVAKAAHGDPPWLRVQHDDGDAAVKAAWEQVQGGKGHPRAGHILSLAGETTRI